MRPLSCCGSIAVHAGKTGVGGVIAGLLVHLGLVE